MSQNNAVELMRREMRVRHGTVPSDLDGHTVESDCYLMSENSFLLRIPCGLRIYYRKGEGITIERGLQSTLNDEMLYLNGTTYAAVASINGFYPIHASAVAVSGQVYAFTGESGSGKSTLVAELDRHGLKAFCDDTLILDMREEGVITCLPGHKRLKLWADALIMTGTPAGEQVSSDIEKFYADPKAGMETRILPLAELCFLEEGEPTRIEKVSIGQRLLLLQDNHYTAEVYHFAARPQPARRFMQLARLAAEVRISRFVRPRDARRFQDQAELVANHIRSIQRGAT